MSGSIDDQRRRPTVADAGSAFVAAIAAGDAHAAAGAYAPSARLLAPAIDPIEGRPAIAEFWRAGIDAGIRDVVRVQLQLEHHGRVAVEFGRYAIRVDPTDSSPLVDRGKYLLVHELQVDGSWRWAVEMLTPDGPPEPRPRHHRHDREVTSD
jgi:ketosteroid isomerase-like protein